MNGPVSLDELLEVAVEAARVTGGHALANVGRRHEVDERTPHDVKLRL
ncbi:MAG: hypothetical protein GWN37_13940, partial [Gammaproteobacteria bacterium]|nr:hypothetical protein [Gammaproteobacteria bacterium]